MNCRNPCNVSDLSHAPKSGCTAPNEDEGKPVALIETDPIVFIESGRADYVAASLASPLNL